MVIVPATPRPRPRRPWAPSLRHQFAVRCFGPDGRLLWEETLRNRLSNQGQSDVVATIYQAVAWPSATLYGRLYNYSPLQTDTLGTLTNEMSGNGYAAVGWTRGTTDFPGTPAVLSTGESEIVGVAKTYGPATGAGIGPFTYFVFATTSDNTGHFISYAPFSAARTILAGASLQVQPRCRIRGVSV